MNKLMLRSLLSLLLLVPGILLAAESEPLAETLAEPPIGTGASGESTAPANRSTRRKPDEEMTVYGNRDGASETDVLLDLYQGREHGFRLYRAKKYKEAFPHIEQAAIAGLKDAQALLGYMYQWGQGVEQDNDKAIGWMGVAAQGKTIHNVKTYWKDMLRQIPEELMPRVNELVAEYDERYGAKVTNTVCQKHHTVGTWRRAYDCRVENDSDLLGTGLGDDYGFGADGTTF